jgi:RNA polymerase sigma-70 factor (ECF subfamily)
LGPTAFHAAITLLWLVEPRERKVRILVGEREQVSKVARCLEVPTGTAFSRLRRGRKRLAGVLKRRRGVR